MSSRLTTIELLAVAIITFLNPSAHAQTGFPCIWPRCHKQAVSTAPQLCAEHMRYPEKPEGEKLRDLIWANDVAGIRRLAPITGPDYLIHYSPPLMHAVYSGNVEAAKALIDAGADANWRAANGENLVYISAMKNKPRMAAFFISQGVGTLNDARRGGLETAMVEGIARGMEGAINDEVERTTGVRPKTTAREAWKKLEDIYNNYPGNQPEAKDGEGYRSNTPSSGSDRGSDDPFQKKLDADFKKLFPNKKLK